MGRLERTESAALVRLASASFDSASAKKPRSSKQASEARDPLLLEIASWTHDAEWVSQNALIRQAWTYQASWEGVMPLRRAEIRLRSRWRDALTRKLLWGLGRRHAAMAGAIATCVLTAACASAVKTTPSEVQVAAGVPNEPGERPTALRPQTYSRATHAMRTAAAERAAADRLAAAAAPAVTIAEAPAPEAPASSFASNEIAPPADEREAQLGFSAPAYEDPNGQSSFFHQSAPTPQPLTKLVAFNSAPFPYHGASPTGGSFLNVQSNGQLGHRTRRGAVLWESKTFSDSRVLVHVPPGFDPSRPAAIVVFFHGYGATLPRDVRDRQQVPSQITKSGANVILVAPQFAVDARDPSIGHFWEAGGFRQFMAETAKKLADLQGDPSLESTFSQLPIVMVAYSGGFYPAAWCIKDLGTSHRIRGVLMLDAVYGELDRYADWAAANRSSFLVSAYTRYTARQNQALRAMLAARGVATSSSLARNLRNGAVFLPAETSHQDYVTRSYTDDPIKDILTRLPEYRMYDPQAVASIDGPTTTASIH